MSKEMNNIVESEETVDKTQKDYVINVFKDMYLKYKDTFKDEGLTDVQLANKFENNIMPGFFDFALLNGHKFGSIIRTSISNYLSVKHGCWLNTIDYAVKYEPKNLQLAVGFIVHKNDLEKIKRDIENGITPVYVDLIPHGFFVDTDGDIFDPTLGANEDFHYFYKTVPEEIWRSFKYFYNNPKDWWVADFADWTKEQIRSSKESHEFFKFVGIDVPEESLEDTADSNASVVKVEVRNERGELVDIEDTLPVEQSSERDATGIVDVRNEKGRSSFSESVAVTEDVMGDTITLDDIPEGSVDDFMTGDIDNESRIPNDDELEERVDEYIEAASKVELVKTKSGHIYKRNEIADPSLSDNDAKSSKGSVPAAKFNSDGFVVPTLKTDFINAQIENYGNLLKDTFIKGVNDAKEIRNTTTVFNLKGVGTLDSAAKTYYPFGHGEKTSRSKSAAGFEDTIPFYLTYFFSFADSEGNIVEITEDKIKEAKNNNEKYSIIRTLALTQPKTVYQYRCQIPNASIFNKPVKVDAEGKAVSTDKMYKIPVATNESAKKFSVVYVVCDNASVDFVKNSTSGIIETGEVEGLTYFYIFKLVNDVKDYVKKCNDYLNSLENKEDVTFVVSEFTNDNVSCSFKDLVEQRNTSNCTTYIANAKEYKDFDVKSLGLQGFYIATNKGQLPGNYFGDFTFVNEDKTSDTIGLDKDFVKFSDKLYLYRVHGDDDQEEGVYKWIVAAPDYLIKDGNLSEVKIDEDYNLFQIFAITMKTEYPGMPKESDYLKGKAAWKIYQWLDREYQINRKRAEFDDQLHMRRGYLDIERAIPAFSFVKNEIEDFDENKLSIENNKEWIKHVLCSKDSMNWIAVNKNTAAGFALDELFVHYAVSLNVKLRYYLDRLQIIDSAGEKQLTTQNYQGIVVDNGVDIGSTTNFKYLDNYIAQVVATSIPENNDVMKAQLNAILDSREQNLKELQSQVIDKVQQRVEEIDANLSTSPYTKVYVETTEHGARQFYTKIGGQKKYLTNVNFINQVFYKENGSGKDETVVCSYDNDYNLVFEPVDEFCRNKESELESVKRSYETGDHSLYSDIANVVRFGLENGCYYGGFWNKVEQNSIANILAPYAFGTENYNSLIDRLNMYFKLSESLFPASSNIYDLRILKDKLDDCRTILQEMYEDYKDIRYHLSLKLQDEETGQNEFKTKNINEYVKLYSGHSDETNVDTEQEEKWKRLCQYLNFDIYPKIMEDEYNELREVAKSQQRLTQGVKMTVRMKEFATKVADIPFDFTTKSILFSALKNYGNAKGIANTFSEIFKNVKEDNNENIYGNYSDAYASYDQMDYDDKQMVSIKTSSAFKSEASNRNSVESFLKQFDKLKDSYEYSFLNDLLYKDATDDDIWKMRDVIAKGFGFDLKKESENFNSIEEFKDCFVKSIRQLLTDYTGYKGSKIATLYNRINSNNYSLRDLNNYYKSRMSDIVGSLKTFISDLSKVAKTEKGKQLVNDIKTVSGIVQGSKETRINAMKNIVDSADILGNKYIWLLAKFDEMTSLYENYKEVQGKLKEYINAEIKRINPSKKDLEAANADEEILKDEGLDEITNMFLKNIYSAWKISMFDAFKKEQPDDLKSVEQTVVFNNENDKNPYFIGSWVKAFNLNDEQKNKIVGFIAECRKLEDKNYLNVLKDFTKDQIQSVINVIVKDDVDFKDSIKFIDAIASINKTAETQNIYSFNSVDKKIQPSKVMSDVVYTDTIISDLTTREIEGLEFWKQFVKDDLDADKTEQLKTFVNEVLKRVNGQPDLLKSLNVERVEKVLSKYFEANKASPEKVIDNARKFSAMLFKNQASYQKISIARLQK